jgi:hypothetical protein
MGSEELYDIAGNGGSTEPVALLLPSRDHAGRVKLAIERSSGRPGSEKGLFPAVAADGPGRRQAESAMKM